MNERHSNQRRLAEVSFASAQKRPVDHAQQQLSFSNAERLIKTARLRELRLAQNRFKPS